MISDEIIANLVPFERGIGDDLGEIGSFEEFSISVSWLPRDNDETEIGPSTVVKCMITSFSVKDSRVNLKIVNDTQFNISGEYTLETFDRLSYEFKDIETNETFKMQGWPPTDPRTEYMYKLNLDPRESVENRIVLDYIIEFDVSAYTPLELISLKSNELYYVDGTKAYRRDRVDYIHFVRNYSHRRLGRELADHFKQFEKNNDALD